MKARQIISVVTGTILAAAIAVGTFQADTVNIQAAGKNYTAYTIEKQITRDLVDSTVTSVKSSDSKVASVCRSGFMANQAIVDIKKPGKTNITIKGRGGSKKEDSFSLQVKDIKDVIKTSIIRQKNGIIVFRAKNLSDSYFDEINFLVALDPVNQGSYTPVYMVMPPHATMYEIIAYEDNLPESYDPEIKISSVIRSSISGTKKVSAKDYSFSSKHVKRKYYPGAGYIDNTIKNTKSKKKICYVLSARFFDADGEIVGTDFNKGSLVRGAKLTPYLKNEGSVAAKYKVDKYVFTFTS